MYSIINEKEAANSPEFGDGLEFKGWEERAGVTALMERGVAVGQLTNLTVTGRGGKSLVAEGVVVQSREKLLPFIATYYASWPYRGFEDVSVVLTASSEEEARVFILTKYPRLDITKWLVEEIDCTSLIFKELSYRSS